MVKNTVDGGHSCKKTIQHFAYSPIFCAPFLFFLVLVCHLLNPGPESRLTIWFRYYLKRFKRVAKGRMLQLFSPLSTFHAGFAPKAPAHVIFPLSRLSGNQEQFQRKGGN